MAHAASGISGLNTTQRQLTYNFGVMVSTQGFVSKKEFPLAPIGEALKFQVDRWAELAKEPDSKVLAQFQVDIHTMRSGISIKRRHTSVSAIPNTPNILRSPEPFTYADNVLAFVSTVLDLVNQGVESQTREKTRVLIVLRGKAGEDQAPAAPRVLEVTIPLQSNANLILHLAKLFESKECTDLRKSGSGSFGALIEFQ